MRHPAALVDSVVLIAASHRRDQNHAHALPILMAADEGKIPPLALTDFILAETLNFLTKKGGSAIGRDALRRLEASQGFEIHRTTDQVYHQAKNEIYHTHDGLSFVDALIVAFMNQTRREWIYSFDEGFDRVAGITRAAALP
jgi:uncharacterized protein